MFQHFVNRKNINIIVSIISQFLIMLCGLFLPKIIISNIGSEINGYISTSTTIFGYVSLVEAGLGAACLNALYKPIAENDDNKISSIIKSASKQFNIIALIYFIIGSIIAIIFPFCVKSSYNYWTLFFIIFLEACGGAVFILTTSYIKQFLLASGRHYIELIIHTLMYGVGCAVKILIILYTKNPVLMQVGYFSTQVIECLAFLFYFKKKHPIYCTKEKQDKVTFPERKYFTIHQISNAIFSSTDLILVSTICSLNMASVYSIYGIVFFSIARVLGSVFSSLSYLLGNTYFKDEQQFRKVRDTFNILYNALCFALFTTALILCNPFIDLYTSGSDINYIDKYLPFLFFSTQIMSIVRSVSNNTIKIAGHIKQNVWATILESAINLAVSIPCCIYLGVYGVLIGTIAALLFRTTQTIIYENRIILKQKSCKDFIFIFIFLGVAAIEYYLSTLLHLKFETYGWFILVAIITTICSAILFGICSIFMSKELRKKIGYCFKK